MENNEVISHVRQRLIKNNVIEKIAPDIAFSLHRISDIQLVEIINKVVSKDYVVQNEEYCFYKNPSKIKKDIELESDLSFVEKQIIDDKFCYILKPKVVKAIELLLFNPEELLKSLNCSKKI